MKRVASVTMNGAMRRPVTNEALIAPKVSADKNDRGDRDEEGNVRQVEAHYHRNEIHDRADREIDAPHQEHEGHADRHDRDMRRLRENVAEIGERDEAVRHEAEGDAQDCEKHQRREPKGDQNEGAGVQPAQSALPQSHSAVLISVSRSKRPRSKKPRTSPRPMTMMRSAMPISSSISEDMKSTAAPAPTISLMIL